MIGGYSFKLDLGLDFGRYFLNVVSGRYSVNLYVRVYNICRSMWLRRLRTSIEIRKIWLYYQIIKRAGIQHKVVKYDPFYLKSEKPNVYHTATKAKFPKDSQPPSNSLLHKKWIWTSECT